MLTSHSPGSRRDLAKMIIGTAAAVTALGATAPAAQAYQGNMERALSELYAALASLREASSNKGGHRVAAMQLIKQAIAETEAGIEFADEHGGGGAP